MSYLTVNSYKDLCQNKHQTRIRTLILIISISFGESLFTGSHVCKWGKIEFQQREQYTLENTTRARELEGLHPEENYPKPKRKDTFDKHSSAHMDPRAQMTF